MGSGGFKDVVKVALPRALYRSYRRALIAHKVRTYDNKRVTHTFGSFPLTVSLEDPLAAGWYDDDWDVPPEIRALQQFGARAGATVFDLGAHQCIVALMLSRLVGMHGHVVAVEAERHNVEVGARNLELNRPHSVTLTHAAASDAPGRVLFAEGLNGRLDPSGSRWGKVEVEAVTVDQLSDAHGQPDAVLIDVEGWEASVLRGAQETIAKGAAFCVEVHSGHGLEESGGSVDDIVNAFPNDYSLMVVDSDGLLRPFDESDMSGRFFLVAALAA